MAQGKPFTFWKRCPRCGKEFLVPDLTTYTYKHNGKAMCSYTCWLRYRGVDRHGNKVDKGGVK